MAWKIVYYKMIKSMDYLALKINEKAFTLRVNAFFCGVTK